MKILLIEDNENIFSFLKKGFKEDGHILEYADNGEYGEYLATFNDYDVIIMDWMLPQKSGIEVLTSLRNKNIITPVIMLTAKDEIKNKVFGLKKGADDYLSKPFAYSELLARIEALFRRNISKGKNIIEIKDLIIDINAKTVIKNGNNIELTLKEYQLLIFLIKNKNILISNDIIEDQLWGNDTYINSNVIQVTVYHLRKKIGKDLIKSVRGMGYKIED